MVDRFETAVLGRSDDIVPFLGCPEELWWKLQNGILMPNLSIVETDKRRILVSPDIIPYSLRTEPVKTDVGERDAKRNVKSVCLQVVAHYRWRSDEITIILYLTEKHVSKHWNSGSPFLLQK